MKPIVALKTEHGLIDQMIKLARDEALKIATKDELNLVARPLHATRNPPRGHPVVSAARGPITICAAPMHC